VPPQAEGEPSVVAKTSAPATPPPPAPATVVEEGEAVAEATATQAALGASSKDGPSDEGVVMILDEDSARPPLVNTKNWYRKGTDLWAEFGKEVPFDRKFSSKDSVKILAVGSTPSFGRRAVCA
jgi:hypothetical protein